MVTSWVYFYDTGRISHNCVSLWFFKVSWTSSMEGGESFLLLLLNTYCEGLFTEPLCFQLFFKLKICRTSNMVHLCRDMIENDAVCLFQFDCSVTWGMRMVKEVAQRLFEELQEQIEWKARHSGFELCKIKEKKKSPNIQSYNLVELLLPQE